MDKLELKDLKYIEARAQGKNKTESAMYATGTTNKHTANVQSQRIEKKPIVQTELQKQLKLKKITIARVLQPIADALEAEKVVREFETGETYTVPDHAIRLKAVDMALKLLNIKGEAPKNMANDMIKVIEETDEVELSRAVFRKNNG